MRVRTKCLIALFISFLSLAAIIWAKDEPWKGKPYEQWDKKDVERILTDSPWSRVVTITRTWIPLTGKDLPQEMISGGSRQLSTQLEKSNESSTGGDLNINVYWGSSRVMRAAAARKTELEGSKAKVDVGKYASEPQEEYQIVVQSEDMAPFFRHDEKFFQGVAFLQLKKSKSKFSPSHVHYERDANTTLVTAAVFYFPKKSASGTPTISSDEKSAEFSCKLEATLLQANFELQKMADTSGPDL